MKRAFVLLSTMFMALHAVAAGPYSLSYKTGKEYDIVQQPFVYEINGTLYSIHNFQNDTTLYKNIIFTKYKQNGAVAFTKEFAGEEFLAASCVKTADNHILVCGKTFFSNTHFSVFKIDTTGAVVWSKRYDASNTYSSLFVIDAEEVSNGYNVFVGPSTYDIFSATYTTDFMMMRIDKTDGSIQFQKSVEAGGDFKVFLARQLQNGNYFLAGNVVTFPGQKPFVMVIDANGSIVWNKTITDPWISTLKFRSLQEDVSGDLYISGSLEYDYSELKSDALLIKLDANGNSIFTKCYKVQGEESGERIICTKLGSNGLTVSGTYYDGTAPKNFMAGITTAGNVSYLNAYRLNQSYLAIPSGVLGGLCEPYFETADGDKIFANNVYNDCVSTNYHFMIFRTGTTGETDCDSMDYQMSLTDTTVVLSTGTTSISASGEILTASAYTPTSAPAQLHTYNVCDCTTASVNETIANRSNYAVYPNPSAGTFQIKGVRATGDRIVIRDITGKEISTTENYRGELISIAGKVSSGMYYVHVYEQDQLAAILKIAIIQ